MTVLNAYVSFNGTAREAMTFYQSVLGGDLVLNTFGDIGSTGDPTADLGIMHGQLTTPGGLILMGADGAPGQPWDGGSRVSLSLSGDDAATLTDYYERLSEGGTVQVPLERQMWGDVFGMFADKYGVEWLVNITAAE